MNLLQEEKINCPYCGEAIDVLIEAEDMEQQYIEDCQVCCKPITFVISSNLDGDLCVSVHGENETF